MLCHKITGELIFSVAPNSWLPIRIIWNIKKKKTKKEFSDFTPGDAALIAMEWGLGGGIFKKHPGHSHMQSRLRTVSMCRTTISLDPH